MARQEVGLGGGGNGLDGSCSGQRYVAGCCGCDNEPQGFIKRD
jgi:hypothetical protein